MTAWPTDGVLRTGNRCRRCAISSRPPSLKPDARSRARPCCRSILKSSGDVGQEARWDRRWGRRPPRRAATRSASLLATVQAASLEVQRTLAAQCGYRPDQAHRDFSTRKPKSAIEKVRARPRVCRSPVQVSDRLIKGACLPSPIDPINIFGARRPPAAFVGTPLPPVLLSALLKYNCRHASEIRDPGGGLSSPPRVEGAFAAVRRRGAEEAGAIFIKLNRLDGTAELFWPDTASAFGTAHPSDRAFSRCFKASPSPEARSKNGSRGRSASIPMSGSSRSRTAPGEFSRFGRRPDRAGAPDRRRAPLLGRAAAPCAALETRRANEGRRWTAARRSMGARDRLPRGGGGVC